LTAYGNVSAENEPGPLEDTGIKDRKVNNQVSGITRENRGKIICMLQEIRIVCQIRTELTTQVITTLKKLERSEHRELNEGKKLK
jgi:hypothetical protein